MRYASIGLLVLTSLAWAQSAPRPLAVEDLLAAKTIGEIQVAPNGRQIVFTVATADLSANRQQNQVWRLPMEGGTPEAIANLPEGVNTIRWSPNGRSLAFFAQEKGKEGLYVMTVEDGKVTRVCDYDHSNHYLAHSGNMLAWSPDNTQLAFAGTRDPKPDSRDPLVIDRSQFKTRTSFSDNRRTHLFVVAAAGGEVKQLTYGEHDEHSIDWGGTGKEIVFLSNHEKDPDARLNYDIFAVNVAAGHVRQITRTPGVEMDPHLSPNGTTIAYIATTRPVTTIDSIAEDAHLWVVPFDEGTPKELNAALDRRTSSPVWSSDGQSVYFLVGDQGKTLLCRVPAEGGTVETLINRKGQVSAYTVARRTGEIVGAVSTPQMPPELYRYTRQDGQPVALTKLNADLVKGWKLVAPESLRFKSFDGVEVEGFYYPPVEAKAKVPMILSIHGGPHGQFGYAFNPAFQIYAGHGYATLAINPRGSSGYGQKFSDGSLNAWGGGDYKDLMAGVDAVLKLHPEIDPKRLGVTGGSYGGFMTNWVITQTDRFRAAVSSASVSNLISFYGTSLYQDLVHAEFSGFPWDGQNFDLLWKWSPLRYVQQVKTPTMFLHGELDHDVPIGQAEEMYEAIRRRGIPATLVRYPREGHGAREPKHRVDQIRRTLEWMDRYLAPAS